MATPPQPDPDVPRVLCRGTPARSSRCSDSFRANKAAVQRHEFQSDTSPRARTSTVYAAGLRHAVVPERRSDHRQTIQFRALHRLGHAPRDNPNLTVRVQAAMAAASARGIPEILNYCGVIASPPRCPSCPSFAAINGTINGAFYLSSARLDRPDHRRHEQHVPLLRASQRDLHSGGLALLRLVGRLRRGGYDLHDPLSDQCVQEDPASHRGI